MNFFLIVALTNALTSGLMSFFILVNNSKTKTNRYFGYYALCVTGWAIFQLFWIYFTGKDSLFCIRTALLFATFIPPTFLHFTSHLLNEYHKHKRIIIFVYAISFALTPFEYSPLFIKDVLSINMVNSWPLAGPLFIFYVLEYMLAIAYALFTISKKIKTTSGAQKIQLKYIFYGILIAYIGGATNFPLCYYIPIYPIGNIFIPVYCIFITYAIFRYQLMDIKILLKRSLIYSILITLITIIFLILVLSIERISQDLIGSRHDLLTSIMLSIIIALIFTPLKNFIQNLIEKSFFKGTYSQISEENELLRQEITQTDKLKAISTLASGMAHEIKNPLTVLKTFSEYLPQRLDDKEFLKKFAPMISQEVERIDSLVHELLDFARPAEPVLKPTNICNLVQSTTNLLSNQYIKYNINVEKTYTISDNTLLLLDPNQIKQALLNILLNAIDVMKSGGKLNVTICPALEDKKIHIKVRDTGCGIDPKDLPHIFDPFYSKKDDGTGLGLSITYEIIKKHNGKIFVESEIGKGTTFVLELLL